MFARRGWGGPRPGAILSAAAAASRAVRWRRRGARRGRCLLWFLVSDASVRNCADKDGRRGPGVRRYPFTSSRFSQDWNASSVWSGIPRRETIEYLQACVVGHLVCGMSAPHSGPFE